uniref:BTB domain-containing protein n=1 Tax=Rhabditophanes sp. KR3021 TaxID=114890 RepID=A0AC35U1E2_9BILA
MYHQKMLHMDASKNPNIKVFTSLDAAYGFNKGDLGIEIKKGSCCEAVCFKVHKEVMTANSLYWKNLMESDVDMSEGMYPFEFDEESFRKLLNLLYKGKCFLAEDKIPAFMRILDFFSFDEVLKTAYEQILPHICESNAVELFVQFNRTISVPPPNMEKVRRVVIENFSAVARVSLFYLFKEEEIVDLIKEDKININEQDLIDVLVWYSNNFNCASDLSNEQRGTVLERLLKYVRFQHIDGEYINLHFSAIKLLHRPAIQQLIQFAIDGKKIGSDNQLPIQMRGPKREAY